MAQNLANKYAKKVDERFHLGSLTDSVVNNEYEWTGVATVNVYGVNVPALGNYTRTGSARYGTAAELGTTKQDLTLARDRAFTFTIDRGNHTEEMMVTEGGKALARTIDEVVVPEIDSWRISKMVTGAGNNTTNAVITSSNAYTKFLEANELMSEDKVPLGGRVALCTYGFYNFLKQGGFILDSEKGQAMLVNGQIGTCDGVKLVPIPSSYFPANKVLVVAHSQATVGPKKLQDYKTHDNPPGINGWLVEGRLIYDAFVLNNKANAIAVHTNTV